MARCAGRCYVSPAFGESRNLRLSLSDSRSLEPAGLKFRGKSQRRLSFFRRIMATDESISARPGMMIHLLISYEPFCFGDVKM